MTSSAQSQPVTREITFQNDLHPSRRTASLWIAVLTSLGVIHLVAASKVVAQQQTYAIYALEGIAWNGIPCETFGKSIADENGQTRFVAGYARNDESGMLPVVWMVDESGVSVAKVLEFPSLVFASAVAVSINNYGQIIGGGVVDSSTGSAVGLYWADSLAMPVIFPSLAGEIVGEVQQIGDSGVVVGISKSASGSKAVAWRIMADDSIVGPIVLPTRSRSLAGDDAALGIRSASSSSVEIVGRSAGAPVAWKVNLSATGLALSGGAEVLDSTNEATGVNSTGSICGKARDRVVVWGALIGKKRTKTQLQFDAKIFGTAGRSSAVNNLGMVVGDANLKVAYPAQRAVLWTNFTAPMRTLESLTNGNHPFAYLESASSINSAGEIAGYGWQGLGAGYQAYIAIPNN
jgi:hypothetical protein